MGGQEQENQLAESQDKDQPKPRVKARRLPTYYSRVVTQTQRESIYEIQDRYDLEIQKIEAQILEKVKERDQEVEKILEPDQLAQVKRWTEEAKQRRAGRDSQR